MRDVRVYTRVGSKPWVSFVHVVRVHLCAYCACAYVVRVYMCMCTCCACAHVVRVHMFCVCVPIAAVLCT